MLHSKEGCFPYAFYVFRKWFIFSVNVDPQHILHIPNVYAFQSYQTQITKSCSQRRLYRNLTQSEMQYTTASMANHLFFSLMGTFCQDAGDFADTFCRRLPKQEMKSQGEKSSLVSLLLVLLAFYSWSNILLRKTE